MEKRIKSQCWANPGVTSRAPFIRPLCVPWAQCMRLYSRGGPVRRGQALGAPPNPASIFVAGLMDVSLLTISTMTLPPPLWGGNWGVTVLVSWSAGPSYPMVASTGLGNRGWRTHESPHVPQGLVESLGCWVSASQISLSSGRGQGQWGVGVSPQLKEKTMGQLQKRAQVHCP